MLDGRPSSSRVLLEFLGVIAFAVVFGFWWAFKPRWSRVARGANGLSDPLVTAPGATRGPARSPRAVAGPEPRRRRRTGSALTSRACRAIAVLLVLGYHIGEVRYGGDRGSASRPWFFDGGFVGVDVFFVLSGFLITSCCCAN